MECHSDFHEAMAKIEARSTEPLRLELQSTCSQRPAELLALRYGGLTPSFRDLGTGLALTQRERHQRRQRDR